MILNIVIAIIFLILLMIIVIIVVIIFFLWGILIRRAVSLRSFGKDLPATARGSASLHAK